MASNKTAPADSMNSVESSDSVWQVALQLKDCGLHSDYKAPSAQMFSVEHVNMTRLDSDPANVSPSALKSNLKPVSAMVLRWTPPPPHSHSYCLHHLIDNESRPHVKNSSSSPMEVVMRRCIARFGPSKPLDNNMRRQSRALRGFNFVLERTSTVSPHRPGITIGTYPTW